MLVVLAGLLIAAQQPTTRSEKALGTAWIFSTVAHSAWCPAGNVRLDLRTGHYVLTYRLSRRVCGEPGQERAVRNGRLGGEPLLALRSGFRRIEKEGFVHPNCRDGKPLDVITVSNGGTPILVLSDGAATAAAPDNLTCWSDAAKSLHDLLDETFREARTP